MENIHALLQGHSIKPTVTNLNLHYWQQEAPKIDSNPVLIIIDKQTGLPSFKSPITQGLWNENKHVLYLSKEKVTIRRQVRRWSRGTLQVSLGQFNVLFLQCLFSNPLNPSNCDNKHVLSRTLSKFDDLGAQARHYSPRVYSSWKSACFVLGLLQPAKDATWSCEDFEGVSNSSVFIAPSKWKASSHLCSHHCKSSK